MIMNNFQNIHLRETSAFGKEIHGYHHETLHFLNTMFEYVNYKYVDQKMTS